MEDAIKTLKREVNIIIAEDDEGHATLIKRTIRRAGLQNEIIHFTDGRQILDYLFNEANLQKKINCLLLLDIRMPKVDGISVLRVLRQDKILNEIPVIMITTNDDPREMEKCYELGCRNYVIKPINNENLVDAFLQAELLFK